jgi:DNA adenine methylase
MSAADFQSDYQTFRLLAESSLVKADKEHTFHYIDPPYYNSNCGHYGGYTLDDFENLLRTCGELKGKFMMSSYPSEILTAYTKQFGWKTIAIEMSKSAGHSTGSDNKKVEVITMNY